ncbi:terminase large subunit, partial [Embleya sp. NPDC001921]
MATKTATRSPDLKRLKISPEVAWYLEERGIPLPDCPPAVQTPSPGEAPGAVFDPDRVDKVLKAFGLLRHTQGQWAGQPLKPDPWQVAYILAPVFG